MEVNPCTHIYKTSFLMMYTDMFYFFNTGNILILRSISIYKELQTPTNLFLASLAVADLLITLTLPLYAVSYFYRPQRSWGKVILSQASVILSTGGGVCCLGVCSGGMPGPRGVSAPGGRGCLLEVPP